ncbi:uncharacterized protein MYCGRDRAFT_97806 [Zymoseptoria tritici IPO323]|uniref:Uncharacterized protein n=1 Tax=Zymoseptoria tritici (strain CBS 115943 / IPO323) TaxID=336722 RepID=F9XRF5_ZYMTI|nr:uncharacterized protein MYCGRDRAFT_97806 [Zymoseptoria tritici IPO323]EGP82175.1 hypothetical protein MYCGRDRAFT_97806 [Zymoseptoria tritici IPO323]
MLLSAYRLEAPALGGPHWIDQVNFILYIHNTLDTPRSHLRPLLRHYANWVDQLLVKTSKHASSSAPTISSTKREKENGMKKKKKDKTAFSCYRYRHYKINLIEMAMLHLLVHLLLLRNPITFRLQSIRVHRDPTGIDITDVYILNNVKIYRHPLQSGQGIEQDVGGEWIVYRAGRLRTVDVLAARDRRRRRRNHHARGALGLLFLLGIDKHQTTSRVLHLLQAPPMKGSGVPLGSPHPSTAGQDAWFYPNAPR